ncbi:MAG: M15 family metallopeptidase [Clostridium sp.]
MSEIQSQRAKQNKSVLAKKQKIKRKRIRRVRFIITALVIFTAGVYMFRNSNDTIIGENRIEGSNIMLVNKTYMLEDKFVPKDMVRVDIDFLPDATEEEHYMTKEAARALKKLVNGAAKDGVILTGLSGYRSYETQRTLYNYNIEVNGQNYADRYVAPPGGSEHQLGEAMDLATQWGWITEGCPEAQWIAANAHQYGFIVRYESGKEDITGYNYEPWHVRYVGIQTAQKIYEESLTLEEYAEK